MKAKRDDLHTQLPYLRRLARSLMGDRDRADSLVEACLIDVLAGGEDHRDGPFERASLYRILYHRFIDRASARHPAQDPGDGAEDPAMHPIEAALQRLTLSQRAAISLVVTERCSHEDAGWVMGVPVETVRSEMEQARAALKLALSQGQARKTGRQGSILVMEDDFIVAQAIGRVANDLGYSVAGYADCQESALSLAERTNPDLILADLKLRDGWTGRTAVHLIQERLANSKVVYVTGYGERLDGDPAPRLGKPFTQDELADAITRSLAESA